MHQDCTASSAGLAAVRIVPFTLLEVKCMLLHVHLAVAVRSSTFAAGAAFCWPCRVGSD